MIQIQKHQYADDTQAYQGVIAYDDSWQGKRPVVLVAHAWMGQSQFEEDKAVALAQLGYLAFAIDVYGQGKRAKNTAEAETLMQAALADRQVLLNRLLLALNTIQQHELANANAIGAIGFCFGGKCVLDLARAGIAIKGVVSFHGIFDKPNLAHQGNIKAKVLVLHGWEDPMAPPEAMVALGQELSQRNAVWEIVAFGHTSHAFTNPQAKAPEQGMHFNPLANNRSWQRMTHFFQEVFTTP